MQPALKGGPPTPQRFDEQAAGRHHGGGIAVLSVAVLVGLLACAALFVGACFFLGEGSEVVLLWGAACVCLAATTAVAILALHLLRPRKEPPGSQVKARAPRAPLRVRLASTQSAFIPALRSSLSRTAPASPAPSGGSPFPEGLERDYVAQAHARAVSAGAGGKRSHVRFAASGRLEAPPGLPSGDVSPRVKVVLGEEEDGGRLKGTARTWTLSRLLSLSWEPRKAPGAPLGRGLDGSPASTPRIAAIGGTLRPSTPEDEEVDDLEQSWSAVAGAISGTTSFDRATARAEQYAMGTQRPYQTSYRGARLIGEIYTAAAEAPEERYTFARGVSDFFTTLRKAPSRTLDSTVVMQTSRRAGTMPPPLVGLPRAPSVAPAAPATQEASLVVTLEEALPHFPTGLLRRLGRFRPVAARWGRGRGGPAPPPLVALVSPGEEYRIRLSLQGADAEGWEVTEGALYIGGAQESIVLQLEALRERLEETEATPRVWAAPWRPPPLGDGEVPLRLSLALRQGPQPASGGGEAASQLITQDLHVLVADAAASAPEAVSAELEPVGAAGQAAGVQLRVGDVGAEALTASWTLHLPRSDEGARGPPVLSGALSSTAAQPPAMASVVAQ